MVRVSFAAICDLPAICADSCSTFTTCSACEQQSGCGWCGSSGVCQTGSAGGPSVGASCTAWFFGVSVCSCTLSLIATDACLPIVTSKQDHCSNAIYCCAGSRPDCHHHWHCPRDGIRHHHCDPCWRTVNDSLAECDVGGRTRGYCSGCHVWVCSCYVHLCRHYVARLCLCVWYVAI